MPENALIRAEWARFAKGTGDAGSIVLAHSNGSIPPSFYSELLVRYSPGTLRRNELPQVIICWFSDGVGSENYVVMAFYRYTDDGPDVRSRSSTLTDFFCIPFRELTYGPLSYMSLYEQLWETALSRSRSDPIAIRAEGLPVLIPAGPELSQARRVAALLLTDRPVCILGANHVPLAERLQFIDTVASLLPYGMRGRLSAGTLASYTVRKHKLRLFFASADRGRGSLDHLVTWGQPERGGPIGDPLAEAYLELLSGGKLLPAVLATYTELMGFGQSDVKRLIARLSRRQDRRFTDMIPDLPGYSGLRDVSSATSRIDWVRRSTDGPPPDLAIDDLRSIWGASPVAETSVMPEPVGEADRPEVTESPQGMVPAGDLPPALSAERVTETTGAVPDRFELTVSSSATGSPAALNLNELLESCRWALENSDEPLLRAGIDRLRGQGHHRKPADVHATARVVEELQLFQIASTVSSPTMSDFYAALLRLAFPLPIDYRSYHRIERLAGKSAGGRLDSALVKAMLQMKLAATVRLLLQNSVPEGKVPAHQVVPHESVTMMAENLDSPVHERIVVNYAVASLRMPRRRSAADQLAFRNAMEHHKLLDVLQDRYGDEPEYLLPVLLEILRYAYSGTLDSRAVRRLFGDLRAAPSPALLGAVLTLARPRDYSLALSEFARSAVLRQQFGKRSDQELRNILNRNRAPGGRRMRSARLPYFPSDAERPQESMLLVLCAIFVFTVILLTIAIYFWLNLAR